MTNDRSGVHRIREERSRKVRLQRRDKLDYVKIKISDSKKYKTYWEEIFIIFTTATTHKNVAFQNIKEALPNQLEKNHHANFLKLQRI